MDPAVHGRRLRLHRHGDRAPGAAAGPLQLRPIADGDPGAAVWRRHDGADRRVRVRTEKSGGGGEKRKGSKERLRINDVFYKFIFFQRFDFILFFTLFSIFL
ncbi:hypothetical protein EYF80_041008 [Liparis tanakae]|uniref:Uncharacterized protein n=1 Tax=Liparis tanakae TaxID=230148 RepID=A0A4Z2G5G3_9TELE|nr:hypothetical protein EYF80_041008 [Liparis tanakae]